MYQRIYFPLYSPVAEAVHLISSQARKFPMVNSHHTVNGRPLYSVSCTSEWEPKSFPRAASAPYGKNHLLAREMKVYGNTFNLVVISSGIEI